MIICVPNISPFLGVYIINKLSNGFTDHLSMILVLDGHRPRGKH